MRGVGRKLKALLKRHMIRVVPGVPAGLNAWHRSGGGDGRACKEWAEVLLLRCMMWRCAAVDLVSIQARLTCHG